MRATFYLPLTAIHEVVQQKTTLLTVHGERFENGSGVSLIAGTVLTLRPSVMGVRRAEVKTDTVIARGGVPRDRVDYVFVPVEHVAPRLSDCELKGPVTVLDAPNGQVVASLVGDHHGPCNTLASASQGTQKIALHDPDMTIVGFVPVTALEVHEPKSIGHSFGMGAGSSWWTSHSRFLYLWPGDLLFPPGASEPLAKVIQRALVVRELSRPEDEVQRIELPLDAGSFTTFSITAATRSAAVEKYAAWLARTTYEKVRVVGGGKLADVMRNLEQQRALVSKCFDDHLADHPKAPVTLHVELEYARDRPDPQFANVSAGDHDLERCLAIMLRSHEASLLGSRAHFVLRLTPDDRIDSGPSSM